MHALLFKKRHRIVSLFTQIFPYTYSCFWGRSQNMLRDIESITWLIIICWYADSLRHQVPIRHVVWWSAHFNKEGQQPISQRNYKDTCLKLLNNISRKLFIKWPVYGIKGIPIELIHAVNIWGALQIQWGVGSPRAVLLWKWCNAISNTHMEYNHNLKNVEK